MYVLNITSKGQNDLEKNKKGRIKVTMCGLRWMKVVQFRQKRERWLTNGCWYMSRQSIWINTSRYVRYVDAHNYKGMDINELTKNKMYKYKLCVPSIKFIKGQDI